MSITTHDAGLTARTRVAAHARTHHTARCGGADGGTAIIAVGVFALALAASSMTFDSAIRVDRRRALTAVAAVKRMVEPLLAVFAAAVGVGAMPRVRRALLRLRRMHPVGFSDGAPTHALTTLL